jgi:P-type Mg2+ transporter
MALKKTQYREAQIKSIHKNLEQCAILSFRKVLRKFDTNTDGLSERDVDIRHDGYGKNVIAGQKPPAWYIIFWISLKTPFNIILFALLIVSYFTSDMTAVAVMGVMISISTLLRFWQEMKALIAAQGLKQLVHNTATVTRKIKEDDRNIAKSFELAIEELVPGDIVHLSAGDMIPADVRLIEAKDLFISQSTLTGEALPVEKHESFEKFNSANPVENYAKKYKITKNDLKEEQIFMLDQPTLCFMGSSVVSGTALGVVIQTGNNTYFGSMATQLLGKRPETAFDKGVDKVSRVLVKFMLLMVPVVFAVNGFIKGDWGDAFLFSISVAVGLTPEMLPMIVNANLARGAIAMAKKKVVVKQLAAIQNFGAMDVLCTDKTGTLTQDKVVLIKHLDMQGNKSQHVLHNAFLNSNFQTGLKNLLDKAVVNKAEEKGLASISNDYRLIDEIPFDFVRRRMSVILQNKNDKTVTFFCKGAVEEMLEKCTMFEETADVVKPLDSANLNKIIRLKDLLSDDGLRVVAVAYKTIDNWKEDQFTVKDEKDLIFSGYIAFLDPPKETTAEALQLLREHGISVKILTGDNPLVARKICRDVGLSVDNILTGPEIEEMTEKDLSGIVKRTSIFAKLSPMNKARIVKNLKDQKHVVGFMGDGINDALALREADVGISVDTGVDLAKEAADIILLEKSLLVLESGIIEGRRTFGNIIKYIKMTASSNFGNVFSILIASAFLPFLPMLPVQLLVQNLLYDISQISIPWDTMDHEFLMTPRKWEAGTIAKFMIFVGPISSIFDIVTFVVMWTVFKANSPEHAALFHSGWFVVGLLTQTLVVHMIRTRKIPFLQSTASFPVLALTITIMIVGVALPFSPFASMIGLQELPLSYFPWLVGILTCYCLLTQVCKVLYIKKFKSWL